MKILDLILIVCTIFLIIKSRKSFTDIFGRNASLYFLTSFLIFLVIRIFFFLNNIQILGLDEMTVMVGWHLMFYLAMAGFVFISLNDPMRPTIFNRASRNSIILLALSVLVFVWAIVFNQSIVSAIEGTWVDRSGIMHFIAFAFAFFISTYFVKMRLITHPLSKAADLLIVFLILYSFVHAWELLGESWHVIPAAGKVLEQFEEFIILPIFVFGLLAFVNVNKAIKQNLPKA